MKSYAIIFCFLSVVSGLSAGCSISGGKGEYDAVVSFSKGEKIQFPDFLLEYLGERTEKKEFPNGNSFTFTFYDFKLTSGTETKTINWSSGTGLIDPAPFEFGGKNFELELRNSEKLSKKLSEDELVIVKK